MQSCSSFSIPTTSIQQRNHRHLAKLRSHLWLQDNACFGKRSKNPIHNVAADSGTGAKDGGVAHLLAELLSVFFKLARLATFCRGNGSGLTYCQRHVAVICRWRGDWVWSLFLDYVDIASWKYTLKARSFISPSPPWQERVSKAVFLRKILDTHSHCSCVL